MLFLNPFWVYSCKLRKENRHGGIWTSRFSFNRMPFLCSNVRLLPAAGKGSFAVSSARKPRPLPKGHHSSTPFQSMPPCLLLPLQMRSTVWQGYRLSLRPLYKKAVKRNPLRSNGQQLALLPWQGAMLLIHPKRHIQAWPNQNGGKCALHFPPFS